MNNKMSFNIRKLIALLSCLVLVVILFAGCSAGTPKADRIKTDLNTSDIIGSKEFFGKNDKQMIPVTKVSIVDKTVEDDECEIKCNVVLEDNNYRIESQVTAFYSKFDKWSFDGYKIGEHTIVPISGVPDYIIKQRAEYVVSSSIGNLAENAQVTNVKHKFDKNAKTDFVTFDLYAKGNTCKMNIKVSTGYSFEDSWRVKESDEEIINHEWLLNDLVGTEWSGLVGIGATRHIVINSVDTANKTMNVSYYSSQDDCSYEITTHYDSPAIKVNLPNESFTDQMWIFEDGEIRYGVPGGLGGMLGKRDDNANKTKKEVIIEGSNEVTETYDTEQLTTEDNKGLPVIPLAIFVVLIVAIVLVLIKKKTGKPESKDYEKPAVDDEPRYGEKIVDEEHSTDITYKEKSTDEIDVDAKSRIKTTFKPAEGVTTPTSEEKTGDWFKSAGDL